MVLNGIDRVDNYAKLFQGRRLGLITSVSGTTRELRSSIQALHERFGLAALFSPEHGVRGDAAAGEHVGSARDPDTGVVVHSLYTAESRRLTPDMLDEVDAVVFDIQDIGARYYTYVSTLLYALEECARHGKTLIVLDRLNPLGDRVEGRPLAEDQRSFVGACAVPNRHGLTAGELALLYRKEQGLDCDLEIVPCEGWRRTMLFPDTGHSWVMPSPNIPRFETALLYVGTCLFEGTNVSEGRGTAAPFELIGAPYIHAERLTEAMRANKLDGVRFSPVYFRPTASKHQGELCGGVHIHLTDRERCAPLDVGIRLLHAIRELHPDDFAFLPPVREGGRPFIRLLSGDPRLEDPNVPPEAILNDYARESRSFDAFKERYHLYDS
ncbi:exo-beta-N-acetylmuramidase NamZ domain-containing protein [Paenibacillaceae bacterium WGS1546]|uniref:exo-beta-N-acetylmuramidase NamZ family protein n=1 Tax=Cohnella sp. WGS1546 TaxID=3366810 RepID=UPI00372CF257